MPRNVGSFSFVKYLYTMDSSMTAKKATVPYTIPVKSPQAVSNNKSYMTALSQVYNSCLLHKSVVIFVGVAGTACAEP